MVQVHIMRLTTVANCGAYFENRLPTLIAEETTPAFLAVTLPRLLAGAMETARVADAVITVLPTEAYSAPDGEKKKYVSAW